MHFYHQASSWIHSRNGSFLLVLVSIFLIFLGFSFNIYHAATPYAIKTYGKISESMVVGRLAESQKNGLLSNGGFLGFAIQEGDTTGDYAKQYRIYGDQLDYKTYNVYRTITGFNGMVLGLFDAATGFSNRINLKLFGIINAFLASVALALMLWFIAYYTGLLAWFFALLSVIFSTTLTAFGANLFFCTWAFYFPFLVVAYILIAEDLTGKYSTRKALLLVFLGISVKCLFNGMEFITTSLVMMMLPLFFFAIKNKWPWLSLVRRFFAFSMVAILGVVLNLGILAVQNGIYSGSARSGLDHIVESWYKRTYDANKDYDFTPQVKKSLSAGVDDAFKQQMGMVAYHVELKKPFNHQGLLKLSLAYRDLFGPITVLSLVLLVMIFIGKADERNRISLAMLAMAWISLLAPVSWLVIFKGHAVIHLTLVTLVWHMPFLILAAAICGLSLKTAASALYYLIFGRI